MLRVRRDGAHTEGCLGLLQFFLSGEIVINARHSAVCAASVEFRCQFIERRVLRTPEIRLLHHKFLCNGPCILIRQINLLYPLCRDLPLSFFLQIKRSSSASFSSAVRFFAQRVICAFIAASFPARCSVVTKIPSGAMCPTAGGNQLHAPVEAGAGIPAPFG